MHSPDDLAAAAEKFTAAMDGHKIFAFYGSMGAGKTTFIRAVCKALGVTEEVTSPSFAIVNEYLSDTTGEHFYHFDFYRIKKINEVYDLGYEDTSTAAVHALSNGRSLLKTFFPPTP